MKAFLRKAVWGGICATCLFAWGGEKPWTEVRSEHFRVLTDGDTKGALDIAREFEQMRAVFAAGAVNMRLDSGVPLVVFATRDASSMQQLASWPTRHENIGGFFHEGWEKQFAVVRVDLDTPGYYQPAYHEYVHTLLHANFHWLPTWLDEGLAEFYGTAEFKDNSAVVGEPSLRKFIFEREKLIPLKTLLAVNRSSPYYNEGNKMNVFYAEAWGLTHYLTFADGMERGKRLGQFYTLLETGMEQEKAFEQVFGPTAQLEDALEKYLHKGKMHAWEFNNPPQILERNFAVRKLSLAETDAELGGYSVWGSHDLKTARRLLSDAVQADPKLAVAHENLGFLDFDEGKDDEAVREFQVAVETDKNRYLSLFAKTMLSPMAHSDSPSDQSDFENALFRVLQGNSQFAPAYIQLGLLYAKQGDLKKATAAANKAAQLQPSRAGYELMLGDLLLQMGRAKDAATIAEYVADRWQGADHDEAVELWNRVPRDQRTALTNLLSQPLEGVQEAEGSVRSVTCGGDGPDRKFSLTLNQGGKEIVFQPSKGFSMGFSDTLWYGRDHFSACHHLENLRAIVHYKPGNGTTPNDLVGLEVRVDLPVVVKPAVADQPLTTEKQ